MTLSDNEEEDKKKISDLPNILLDHFTTLFGSDIPELSDNKKKKKEESCWSIASMDENKINDM